MSEPSIEDLAKLASQKYGREITPEQYEAVDYFAREEALAYRDVFEMLINSELLEKNAAEIEINCRNSLLKAGNLDVFVKRYQKEMSDDLYRLNQVAERQTKRRTEKSECRICNGSMPVFPRYSGNRR